MRAQDENLTRAILAAIERSRLIQWARAVAIDVADVVAVLGPFTGLTSSAVPRWTWKVIVRE